MLVEMHRYEETCWGELWEFWKALKRILDFFYVGFSFEFSWFERIIRGPL